MGLLSRLVRLLVGDRRRPSPPTPPTEPATSQHALESRPRHLTGPACDDSPAFGAPRPRAALRQFILRDERQSLLGSISATIADYRAGELPPPTPDHIERWVRQFDFDVQVPLLRELDYVLARTYLSRATVLHRLESLVRSPEFAEPDHHRFWSQVSFIRSQPEGRSQHAMLRLLDQVLQSRCACGVGGYRGEALHFAYVDDIVFSGLTITNDLKRWIEDEAPATAVVHVIVLADHSYGRYTTTRDLANCVASSGKNVRVEWHSQTTYENRRTYRNTSDVLWPATLPDDGALKAYLARETRYPFEPRRANGGNADGVFSSEQGRQLLEREMLLAGMRIRSMHRSIEPYWRPLGLSSLGLGFGAMVVTHRNCPNNCPLALWWGVQDTRRVHARRPWYPLLPRNTHDLRNDLPDDCSEGFEVTDDPYFL